MTVWFTSDTHFDHKNVINYCSRPFDSVEEMNDTLIHNWNSVVGTDDIVYFLGDFCFSSRHNEFLDVLHGEKHLIVGNHDPLKVCASPKWASANDIKQIRVDNQVIVLCHYAMRVWNRCHRGAWHLYGHSHGSLMDDAGALSLDVGVDCHDYFPISLKRVQELMKKKEYMPVDHHTWRS